MYFRDLIYFYPNRAPALQREEAERIRAEYGVAVSGRRQPFMRKESAGRIPNEHSVALIEHCENLFSTTLLSFCPCGAPAPHEEGAKGGFRMSRA